MRSALLLAMLVCGCKSQPAAAAKPRIDPKRTEPLTIDEVETQVRSVAPEFGTCYRNERRQLFTQELSEFVLQLRVPIDGSQPEVSVVKASIAGQQALESCVVRRSDRGGAMSGSGAVGCVRSDPCYDGELRRNRSFGAEGSAT